MNFLNLIFKIHLREESNFKKEEKKIKIKNKV